MNEIERQVFAAAFAAAFERDWAFRFKHQGVKEAMAGTSDGFQYAEVADQAVKALRSAMTCEDSNYLLAQIEAWLIA